MKRVRLDIGALVASPEEGGNFVFYLSKEGEESCLPVKLTPPQMHAMLSNFKTGSADLTLQHVFMRVLQEYRVELLEVDVVARKEGDGFECELLLFDGEREVRQLSDFADGIVLSKLFGAPIYISRELMDRYAVEMDNISKEAIGDEARLKKLEEELQKAVNNEEYERASLINKEIEKIKRNKDTQIY